MKTFYVYEVVPGKRRVFLGEIEAENGPTAVKVARKQWRAVPFELFYKRYIKNKHSGEIVVPPKEK